MINRDSWTLDSIVETYKHDQRRVRGLRETTLKSYEQVLRPFLRLSLGEDPLDPARLSPADVVRFVTSLQDRYAARSMKYVRTALRSLFRFLRMKGYSSGRRPVIYGVLHGTPSKPDIVVPSRWIWRRDGHCVHARVSRRRPSGVLR